MALCLAREEVGEKMRLRSWVSILGVLALIFTGIPALAHADFIPSTRIDWIGASMSSSQGISVSITPLQDNGESGWSYFSNPCGPGTVGSAMCFGLGIDSNHWANFRLELPNAPTGQFYIPTPGSTCQFSSPNTFSDPNSSKLLCSRSMGDFSLGTKYDFYIAPFSGVSGDSRQWWTAGYINESSNETVDLAHFVFEYSPIVEQTMRNFSLSDQMNATNGTAVADCTNLNGVAGIFGTPKNIPAVVVPSQGPNISTMSALPNIVFTKVVSNCSNSVDSRSADGSVQISLGVQSAASDATPSATPSIGNSSTPITGNLVRPSQGGALARTTCPKNKYLVGISISNTIGTTTFNFVQHLQYFCSSLDPEPSNFKTSSNVVTFVSQGPGNQSVNTIFCPQGSAAADLVLATGAYVKDISLSCYNPTTHFTTLSSLVGAGVGLPIDSATKCPPVNGTPTLITGVDGYAAAGIDAIQAICGIYSATTNATSSPTPIASSTPVPTNSNAKTSNLLLSFLPKSGQNDNTVPVGVQLSTSKIKATGLSAKGSLGMSTSALGFLSDENFNANHYLSFKITPQTGMAIKLSRIEYSSCSYLVPDGQNKTGLSASTSAIFSSIDNFKSPFAMSAPLQPENLTQNIVYQDFSSQITSETELRIHFWGAVGRNWNDLCGSTRGSGLQIFGDINQMPTPPNHPTFNYASNTLNISVEVPNLIKDGIKGVYLVAPLLGFSSDSPLQGVITGTKALFSIPTDSSSRGTSVPVQIYSETTNTQSAPLTTNISIPSVTTPSAKPTPISKPGTKKSVSKSTPKATSDPNQASVPEAPTNPGYDLVGDKVIVTVDLLQTPGAVAKSAFLVAPQIGISANHPLAGKISGNQAHFSIKATSSMAGKTANISVYLTNAAGRSPSLAGQVTAPPVLPDTGSVKAPAKKPVVKSKTASCKKGAIKRIFTGSTCPPGWLKA